MDTPGDGQESDSLADSPSEDQQQEIRMLRAYIQEHGQCTGHVPDPVSGAEAGYVLALLQLKKRDLDYEAACSELMRTTAEIMHMAAEVMVRLPKLFGKPKT